MSLFGPGDFIYFKRGENFTGQLKIACSGTSITPVTFTSYGTSQNLPVFQYGSTGSSVIYLYQRQYVVIDGFKITDNTMDVNNHSMTAKVGYGIDLDQSNYITLRNLDVSLVGVGVSVGGNNNAISNCKFQNMRMVRNTSGGDDDYGANGLVIGGANNSITNNSFKDLWATSYDYGYDGGAVEVYGSATGNNTIMYNTVANCNGFMEVGSGSGGSCNNALIAYNLIVNCGLLVYIQNGSTFTISVSNMQFYNNNIVETVKQYTKPSSMIGMAGSPTAQGIVVVKNNIFWLSSGINVVGSSKLNSGQLTHNNNIYLLVGGNLGFTAHSTEMQLPSSTALFNNTTSTDPSLWDFTLTTSSPALNAGTSVSLTSDFIGTAVLSTDTKPDAGMLEHTGGAAPTLAATATTGTIKCNGNTTTVTISASGGTPPYTGTGNFTVSAGSYNYTVKDANQNTTTTSITVSQPNALNLSVSAGTVTTMGGSTSVTCTASGGTGAYSYSLDGGSYQAANSFQSVLSGSHSITVKDANSCTYTKSFSVTVSTQVPALTATATSGTVKCNGNTTTVTVSASGGTPPYTGTGNFTVSAGSYNYTIKDANQKTSTVSITVSQPNAISISVSAGTVTTAGGYTTATCTASGGSGAYSYSLDGGSYQAGNSFQNVLAGSHSITVKDVNSCTYSKSFSVAEDIPPANPGNLTIRIESKTATPGLCSFDGSISTNAWADMEDVINLSNSSGKGITWNVNTTFSGTYLLKWRYVNGGKNNATTAKLIVNGSTVYSALSFPPTASSTSFTTIETHVSLINGSNTVRLETTVSSAFADIDWFEVTTNNTSSLTTGKCSGTTARKSSATDNGRSLETPNLNSIGVFPNPSNGRVVIGFNLPESDRVSIKIFDSFGRLIDDLGSKSYASGYQQLTYNFKNKPAGAYNIIVATEKAIRKATKVILID